MARRDFSMDYHVDRNASKNSNFGKFIFLIVAILILVFVYKSIFGQSKSVLSANIISPLADGYDIKDDVQNKNIDSGLKNVVDNVLSKSRGSYGVDILDLKTGQEYRQNANMLFESASLYKLWVMAAVYQQVEKGTLNLDQVLTENVIDLNEKFNIDKELAEKKDGVITQSVSDALFSMITKSDNYSALLLSSKVGLSRIGDFLKQNGLINSKIGINGSSPTITAYDTTLFLDKLYNGEFASAPVTSDMITLLKQQVLNEKIPKYLPANAIVAHKTGELNAFSHDAGIVYTPNNQYIISVLSKSDDQKNANETIASLSKAVYEYFEK